MGSMNTRIQFSKIFQVRNAQLGETVVSPGEQGVPIFTPGSGLIVLAAQITLQQAGVPTKPVLWGMKKGCC